tara:strand:+ start:1762 stop:2367 length:606 start_codon:yes stop_codon:yes gene_type:complete
MTDPKPKKCKGTGIAQGYGCGTITRHRTLGLGKMCCYANWLLTSENGKIRLAKATLKVTATRKEFEKYKVERRQRIGLTTLLESVKKSCHQFVRLRDKGKPCISCGTEWHQDFQAGHFFKAELFSTIKFNELNIHGQCVQCNIRKEGNESEYRLNLPKRIGKESYEDLIVLAEQDHKTAFKWDREVLKGIRTYYNKKIKEL